MKRLFVANLPWATNEADLTTLFSEFGPVITASIIKDKETNRSRGFGFVEMKNEADAKLAADKVNNLDYNGRKLVCNIAKPRVENTRRY